MEVVEPPISPSGKEKVKTVSYKQYVWSQHKEDIAREFEGVFRERKEHPERLILFRNCLNELKSGDIYTDTANGLPKIKGDKLASQAFKIDGWDSVLEAYDQCHSAIATLVASSDDSMSGCPSPLIWTSKDPHTAHEFGKYRDTQEKVILVIRPDSRRLILQGDSDDIDGIPYSEAQELQLYKAIRNKRPFIIDEGTIEEFGYPLLEETTLGPYISEDEISAIVKIQSGDSDEFTGMIDNIFGSSRYSQ